MSAQTTKRRGTIPDNDMTRGPEAPEMPNPDNAALFLDFDGTLVEIAERPDAVRLEPGMEDVLIGLHAHTNGRIAIVSGRNLVELERIMPNYPGVIVGSHGAESRIDGAYTTAPEGETTAFIASRDMLRAWVEHYEGVLLEEKPVSLVLHYRQAPDRQSDCEGILSALSQVMPGFVVRPSKMAVELMPENVSKERAVLGLLEEWRDLIPVAIGDDRTDEDMFGAADANGGYAIKVGEGDTAAKYRLSGVGEVHALLRNWLETSERSS
ncbi:trehalose 6-phosphate phosphatase [Palleronia marisminoris]|uniref:Trehalose 6-phosphate phosphatase n=2 Tax=Palleronia marisminoris TaxID=315423 RepID=A0A1Y5SQU5_9RHOB|nr:trehalose 6-phosphate phosphatase [Palleronia marisminoris]SLN46175.1 Trehalose-6-phosphate phosphatase [Palleronia marisminoris]